MNEHVVCFYAESSGRQYKYEGKLISDNDETYVILDMKSGKIRVPKSRSTLIYQKQEEHEEEYTYENE